MCVKIYISNKEELTNQFLYLNNLSGIASINIYNHMLYCYNNPVFTRLIQEKKERLS